MPVPRQRTSSARLTARPTVSLRDSASAIPAFPKGGFGRPSILFFFSRRPRGGGLHLLHFVQRAYLYSLETTCRHAAAMFFTRRS